MLDKLGDPLYPVLHRREYEDFLASMEDTDLVGIGVVSQTGADGLTITSVLKDSPAAAGGLLAGDVIVAVDGRSVRCRSRRPRLLLDQGRGGHTGGSDLSARG